MKQKIIYVLLLLCFYQIPQYANGVEKNKTCGASVQKDNVMSVAYLKIWNPEVQAKIDQDIEKNRKADAVLNIDKLPVGTEVNIEQISNDFLFGGNIFLYGNFKNAEKNRKYEDTFGSIFNAATVPFYWKTLEPEKGKPRYKEGSSFEYRRPAPDPVVAFCASKGINMNGHAIIYGMRAWGQPTWMPENRGKMEEYFEQHIRELAERYKGRVQRWDVVNEPTDQANRGMMPDDYTYKCFEWAMKYFPDSVKLDLNGSDMHWGMGIYRRYLEILRNLLDRDVRINYIGMEMHIFNPKESTKIADGADILTPEKINERLNCMSEAGIPIHVSEVTVSAPDDTEHGKDIQAEITKNLYRLWFSHPNVMGITWWNVADGGAAPGEPSFSGIYDKNMNPKPVFYVLDSLINHSWKTRLNIIVNKNETEKFRGFKGKYRITWKDKSNVQHIKEFYLKNNGDFIKLSN